MSSALYSLMTVQSMHAIHNIQEERITCTSDRSTRKQTQNQIRRAPNEAHHAHKSNKDEDDHLAKNVSLVVRQTSEPTI